MFDDTIAAIATPLARSAISIIRISGDDAIALADGIFSRDLKSADSHTIHYGYIEDGSRKLDEVLVSVFRAPKTYTREDIVEINCHGGPYITRSILQLILAKGARLAKPGEFTQRALLNGRIDLAQAEAVEDMIEAGNGQDVQAALSGIQGSVKKLLEPLIEDLLNLIAQIEVNIDYPEYEDIEQLTTEKLEPLLEALIRRTEEILERSKVRQMYKNGLDTAIVGKPNVGKSSLLNALLDENKAIVTDIPGTTRDIVEGQILAGNLQLNLIDTAGIRKSDDMIEQIGIEKSRQMIDQASLVLLVLDGSRPLEEADEELLKMTEGKKRIVLVNKSDSPADDFTGEGLKISAANKEIDPLLKEFEKLAQEPADALAGSLGNVRQIGLLEAAYQDLLRAKDGIDMMLEPDLVEIDVQSAYRNLKEILGEYHREDLLDALFSNFCLGK